MVYNFNHGLGGASSGVEYAQVYRAKLFRNIGVDAKFVFTDMFSSENIQVLSENIGFLDSEIIWLYTYFTDTKIAPTSYTLADLREQIGNRNYRFERDGKIARFIFDGTGNFYTCYMQDKESCIVHRVEIVSRGYLIRKDYFTYCRIFSEYYGPLDGVAHLYARRFFNEDGTTAYEEIIDGKSVMYRFPNRILYSKEALVGYLVEKLQLSKEDTVIIDRATNIGQAILQNAKPAKIGIVVHADHFSEPNTNDEYILWNNYYEYAFGMHSHIDFYICSTEVQSELLSHQFVKYHGVAPKIVTIPVGSTSELIYPKEKRKKHSLITASRLASEKHIDWLIEATVLVHEQIPDVSLDIYGQGGLENDLKKLIAERHAQRYIRLCGQQKLDDIYQRYEAYFAGSTSEGFGLTLLEAVSSGLPIVGFDVRYGNQTFIENGKNGYLIPYDDELNSQEKIKKLADAMIALLTGLDMSKLHEHSYSIATRYLTSEVEKKWKRLVG